MARIALTLVAVVVVAVAACDPEFEQALDGHEPQGIVGGTETDYEIWKGVVGLVATDGGQPAGMCTGTMIHPRVVLTAGHCVLLSSSSPLQPGEYDFTENPQDLYIKGGANIQGAGGFIIGQAEAAVVHPTWEGELDPPHAVDLAVVKLSEPAPESGYYCMREDSQPQAGEPGIIVGYGLLSSTQWQSSGIHRWGDTTLLGVSLGVIEVGDPTATCQGDSGGPLFTEVSPGNWELTGVTSYGQGLMCQATGGAFSVNTVTYFDWINEQVELLTGDSLGLCNNCGAEGFDCEEQPGDTDADVDGDADADGDADGDADADGDPDIEDDDPHAESSGVDAGGCGCESATGRRVGDGLVGMIARLLGLS